MLLTRSATQAPLNWILVFSEAVTAAVALWREIHLALIPSSPGLSCLTMHWSHRSHSRELGIRCPLLVLSSHPQSRGPWCSRLNWILLICTHQHRVLFFYLFPFICRWLWLSHVFPIFLARKWNASQCAKTAISFFPAKSPPFPSDTAFKEIIIRQERTA